MSMAQIVLLIIGVILFVAGFIIPEKRQELSPQFREEAEQEAKRLVEEAADKAKENLQDSTDETIQYAIEKTERALERITNEKVMSISEYADTVIEDINKNHKQVLFLYDMLNDKQESIKKSVSEAEGKVKKLEHKLEQTEQPEIKENESEQKKEEVKKAEPKKTRTRKKPEPKTSAAQASNESFEILTVEQLTQQDGKVIGENKAEKEEEQPQMPKVDLPLLHAEGTGNGGNSNEQILKLHREGKSNMAIAKELGLGIGEVKIVIDLFEGTK